MHKKGKLQKYSSKIWERLRETQQIFPSLWSPLLSVRQESAPRKNYTQEWFSSLFAPEWVSHGEYLIQSDLSLRDLVIIRDLGPLPADVMPLITIVHNELPRLPDFLRHYRDIGVGRFIIVDHRSNDGTSAFLKQQPDVHLYRAEGNYDQTVSGQMWVTGLARRFAMDRWVLHVDADELLVYDGMENHSLRDLAVLLERRGETRLYAPMLDMYSRHSVLESTVPAGKRLVDVAPYFDPFADNEFIFYECIRLPSRPAMFGYSRARVFGNLSIATDDEKPVRFHMEKFPLSRWNPRTAYCCVHCPFPFSENPPNALGALLHFRFVGKFIEFNKSCAELGEAWDGGSSYQAYADKLRENPSLSFYHAHSRYYHGPQTLISEGFMQAIDWSSKNSHDQFTYIAPAEEKAP